MQKWITSNRRTGDTSQHSRLCNIKLGGSAHRGSILQVIVGEGSSISSICLLTVVNSIEIHGEDLCFAVLSCHRRCQDDLLQFANERILVAHQCIFDQLLGDRATTSDNTPMTQ